MTPPMNVKVGPFVYEIRFVPDSEMEEHGICDNTYLWIKVKTGIPPLQQKVTLLHEIMHAICGVIDGEKKDMRSEEEWCQRTSATLFDVLQNNPLVRRWMFEEVPCAFPSS